MKKTIALLLALIMLLSLSACGKKDVSGLGTLDMDAPAASDGIGTLGQPSADSTPAEQAPTPEPTPVPTEEPAALSLGTRTLMMNNGNIIEQGTHNELIEKHGIYYDLYNMTEL